MKILYVVENLDMRYGGPANSVTNLGIHLSSDFRCEFASLRWYDHERNEYLGDSQLKWHSFPRTVSGPLQYSREYSAFLEGAFLNKSYDLVHIHNLWNCFTYATYKYCIKYSIPFVVSCRGALYPWSLTRRKYLKSAAWSLFQRKMLEDSSFIHVTSQQELGYLRALGVTNEAVVVPNGVVSSASSSFGDAISLLGEVSGSNFILYCSRVHPKKGLEHLINWMIENHAKHDWSIVIAGPIEDDNYFRRLMRLVADSDLGSRIKYVGEVYDDTKTGLYSLAKIFCLPSYAENFGIVVAEALAAGTPVVTTTNTPWEEIDFKFGRCVALENLGDAIDYMISVGEKTLGEMGCKGKDYVNKNFSWENISFEMGNEYKKVIKL